MKEKLIKENHNEKSLTRSQAREEIINKIRKIIPESIIRTGNRTEGSGIVISDNNGMRKFKLYNSKSYNTTTENSVSWSGILKDDLENAYDGYIFSIFSNKQYVLLFTRKQLLDIIESSNRKYDSNKKFHFSFTITADKKVFETRTPQYFDVSYSLENYEIVK